MIIETTHGGMMFALTYLAAILLAAGIAFYSGIKHGYPKRTWMLILTTGLIFFILGEKLAAFSSDQWVELFTRFHLPDATRVTILGGILGLATGLILAKKTLKFNEPVFDHFALALPLAMAVSRVGCLMAGCCFGTPTTLFWGIKYDASSMVYHVHQAEGLINSHSATSLTVHPVQLYQVIGCLVIAFIVWMSRKQWKANGSLFLFSVLCYATLRFLIEFIRAPESSIILTQVFFGTKVLQWIILVVIISGGFLLYIREKSKNYLTPVNSVIHISMSRQLMLILFLCIIVIAGRNWFSLLELATISLFLPPVILLMVIRLYKIISVAGFRWVAPVLLICSFSFMAQKSSTTGPDDKVIFTSAGIMGTLGTYSEGLLLISGQYHPGNCNEIGHWESDTNYIGTTARTFYQGSVDIGYNKWQGKYKRLKIGGRFFFGSESGGMKADHPYSLVLGIHPSIAMDWRWFGFKGGIAIGQMKLPLGMGSTSQHSGEIISKDYRNAYVMPAINLRVGPYDIAYFSLGFPALFPSTYNLFNMSVGSGLGKTDGRNVELGLYDNGAYLKFAYPIKNIVVVEALYGNSFSSGADAASLFSIGATYRIFPEKQK
jgi:phosphatidylglycerol:prolipoprotein diacylglycerol transferase